MKSKTYNIEKLAASEKFDTSIVQRFFYNNNDYYDALTDFSENFGKCLSHYTPVFVVNSEEDRQGFLTECAQVRAKFMRIGVTALLDALSVLEDAAIERNFDAFFDGQVKFNATLKICMDIVKSAESKSKPEKKKKKKKTRTIMVVAPHFENLQQIIATLSDQYNVTGYSNSPSAIASLRGRKPDLFLLQARMPDISGYELAFLIRTTGISVPIWFMTDEKKFDPIKPFVSASEYKYITTPIDENAILKLLNDHFGI